MPESQQLKIKPTYRYRYLYWFFSFLVTLFILMKDRGETVVAHTWFVLISLTTLFYAPFWLSKAIQFYEDQVQENEIAAIGQGALGALERMSLAYRSASQNNTTLS